MVQRSNQVVQNSGRELRYQRLLAMPTVSASIVLCELRAKVRGGRIEKVQVNLYSLLGSLRLAAFVFTAVSPVSEQASEVLHICILVTIGKISGRRTSAVIQAEYGQRGYIRTWQGASLTWPIRLIR